MECVGQAHKVSQNKDLNQTNAEPNAKTADPAIFFSFFHTKTVWDSFKNQKKHFSQAFWGIVQVCETIIDGFTKLFELYNTRIKASF